MAGSSASQSFSQNAIHRGEDQDVDMRMDEGAVKTAPGDSNVVKEEAEPARVVTTFWHLASELRKRIVAQACGEPRLYHRKDPGLSTDCSRTIMKLSLLNRSFYNSMTPLLYKHIRITRPSDLQILLTTLNSHALLGQLVRSIHVGPVDYVSEDWWPIQTNDKGKRMLRIGFIDRAFEDLNMPVWLCPTHAFPLEDEPATELGKTIRAAITAASDYLDVDLLKPYWGPSGYYICRNSWHVRGLEVQAALELYLAEMGRRDKEHREAANKGCPVDSIKASYPRLVVQTDPERTRSPPKPGEDVLWLSRSKILNHLTRRRARTDHFDHPHLFARSNQPWCSAAYSNEAHRGDADPLSDDEVSILGYSSAKFIDVADAPLVRENLDDLLGPALPSTATLGGITALTRSLFSFTPFVEAVSLSGFLERAFCGVRPAPALKALRSLSLGPPPREWYMELRLSDPVFAHLESLRLCGRELSEKDADAIAGVGCHFKSTLKTLQWSLPQQLSQLHDPTLLTTISNLLVVRDEDTVQRRNKRRRRSAPFDEESNSDMSSSDKGSSSDEGSLTSSTRKVSLYIEARLHPEDVDQLFAHPALNDILRSAWRSGGPQPDSNKRLKVIAIDASDEDLYPKWAAIRRAWQLEKEGREWWEAGARRADGNGKIPWDEDDYDDDEEDEAME